MAQQIIKKTGNPMDSPNFYGIKPKIDGKGNVVWDSAEVDTVVRNEFLSNPLGQHSPQRGLKQMSTEFKDAEKTLDDASKAITTNINKFLDLARESSDEVKKITSRIKDNQNQLSDALNNFQRKVATKDLENYVNQTERLVVALTALSKLEENGMLGKVISSMAKS